MIKMLTRTRCIDRRCEAGKCLEIVNEVRLVIVATIESHIGPVNVRSGWDFASRRYESHHREG